MKVFTVVGIKNSGKTTTIECIIRELRRRGHTVGSAKWINCGQSCALRRQGKCQCGHSHDDRTYFSVDTPGTNSSRHREAGSQLVITRSGDETAVMFQRAMSLEEVLSFYDQEYVILEGDYFAEVPRIVTAHAEKDALERITDLTFAVSGRLGAAAETVGGLPAIDATTDIERLVDLIEEKVYDRLPGMDQECCGLCGGNCHEMGTKILRGEAERTDCQLQQKEITLTIGGQDVPLTGYVERTLKGVLLGFVKELRGYREGAPIDIRISGQANHD